MLCPSCGAAIPDDSQRCEFCHRPVATGFQPRPLIPRPEKFQLIDDGVELRIRWRWFNPSVFFLLPFAIAWNAFLVGWYSLAAQMDQELPWGIKLLFLVFPIGHVAVGLALLYGSLILLFNRSEVRIGHQELTVAHGPLPWPGVTLITDEIEQVYCTPATTQATHKTTPGYNLQVTLKDGSTRKLLGPLTDQNEALYLEQTIEERLRIRDRSVPGELPRTS